MLLSSINATHPFIINPQHRENTRKGWRSNPKYERGVIKTTRTRHFVVKFAQNGNVFYRTAVNVTEKKVNKITIRNIVVLWLVWVTAVIGFQALATSRLEPQRPDMLMWFPGDPTDVNFYQQGHPYLLEPFMNNQVWVDSEFYLGISIGGYGNPCMMSTYTADQGAQVSLVPCTDTQHSKAELANKEITPVSYAFFPFYPLLIHLFSIVLNLLQLNPIATATLAGVIVSALGTLAAMLSLYDLTHETLGEEGGMRAVFYLLIFPTSFYFVQVYTEGLFVGLAFTCLAMLKRRRLAYAALLAGAATLTRMVGVSLVIPLGIVWLRTYKPDLLKLDWARLDFKRLPRRILWHALLALTPLIIYLIWQFSYYGAAFHYIETNFFGRPPLDIANGYNLWVGVFNKMIAGFFHLPDAYGQFVSAQFSANYLIEFSCMGIALLAIPLCLKSDPEVAWFSLAVFLIPLVSGPPGLGRYVLAAPALFISLARWGKNPVFDRVWTLASLLVMGLLAMLFAFNFWVA